MAQTIKSDTELTTEDASSGSVFGASLMDSLHGRPVERDRLDGEDLTLHPIPSPPAVGREERYYADGVKKADEAGDRLLREAFKVGQYLTLAADPRADWSAKVKYYSHVVRRHCQPPAHAGGEVKAFFAKLLGQVRDQAGADALRICCEQDELFAVRLNMGQTRDDLADDAEEFFDPIVPPNPNSKPPAIYHEDDWRQLVMIRDQWV